MLYTVRSERMLMEQLNYNLLFRWFVGMNVDDAVWYVTVFTKNRERLLAANAAKRLFAEVLVQVRSHNLLSTEHFTVDGTLIEAWAGHKSFKRKDGLTRTPQTTRAIPRLIFTASGAPTTPTNRRPTPKPGSRARVRARRPSSVTPAMY